MVEGRRTAACDGGREGVEVSDDTESDTTCAWNRCPTCGVLVDVDDCVDGSEVDCGACDERLVLVEYVDDTWSLIPVEFDSEVEQ